MAASNPNNLGYKVTTRDYSALDLVRREWGAEFTAPDHGVYEFSNGRKFDSTDRNNTGFYAGGASGGALEVENLRYPDMFGGYLLTETPSKILVE